jgi:hypothetical protein
MSIRRPTALFIAAALAASVIAAPANAGSTATGLSVAHAAKKCKKGKRHCKKKRPPNPYVEGQPCDPALWKAYAKYDFLCLQQPQPDGTSPFLLVKSRA